MAILGRVIDAGIITAISPTTVTDSSKLWVVNEHSGKWFYHNQSGQALIIISNTVTVLAFAAVSGINISEGYEIRQAGAETLTTQASYAQDALAYSQMAAADRIITEANAISTAQDAVSTNADAVQTAADRVQTGLDRVQTVADRVQTGIDATNAANSAASVVREAANGVAGLDANIEVIRQPAGAAAQLALGRIGARKRADGSWDGLCIALPAGFDLHAWTDELVSGQVYTISPPVNGPVTSGTVFVEVLRLTSDNSILKRRSLRCTAWPSGETYTASNNGATWTPWVKLATDKPLVWTTPTFLSGWVDYGGNNPVAYAQADDGTVFIRGITNGGGNTLTTTVFVLPVGMRPSSRIILDARVSGGSGRLDVYTNGSMVFAGTDPHTGNATTWLSLEASFKGEI